MSEWQPIESVPRDGRKVLIYWPSGTIVVAHWNEARGAWAEEDGGWGSNRWPDEDNGTHWMPLPSPPAAESDARQGE